jgi:hypothetical protein
MQPRDRAETCRSLGPKRRVFMKVDVGMMMEIL